MTSSAFIRRVNEEFDENLKFYVFQQDDRHIDELLKDIHANAFSSDGGNVTHLQQSTPS